MLPNDYSRCSTKDCPKESKCARKMIPDNQYYSISEFNKDNCGSFIEITKEEREIPHVF